MSKLDQSYNSKGTKDIGAAFHEVYNKTSLKNSNGSPDEIMYFSFLHAGECGISEVAQKNCSRRRRNCCISCFRTDEIISI